MKSLTMNHPNWIGQAAIGFGIGAFLGQSGNNHIHHHYAHQITLSINSSQKVKVISERQLYEAPILFIPAHVRHQLMTGYYLSIYIDTGHALTTRINEKLLIPKHVCELPPDLQEQLRQSFTSEITLDQRLIHFLHALQVEQKAHFSNKIEKILALLYQGIVDSDIPDRQCLAQVAGLSESRFSHWFREQTGLPLRSYRKWLRLICGLSQMRKGQALTDIAHQVNFADQAHFTRTCIELFGVRPSELAELQGQIFLIQ